MQGVNKATVFGPRQAQQTRPGGVSTLSKWDGRMKSRSRKFANLPVRPRNQPRALCRLNRKFFNKLPFLSLPNLMTCSFPSLPLLN